MATEVLDINGDGKLQWIDITNPDQAELDSVSSRFDINRYIVKDCLDPDHLPKHEELKNATFFILRVFSGNPKQHLDNLHKLTTKIAIFFSDSFLITIHRLEQPFVEEIRKEELENGQNTTINNLITRILRYGLKSFEQPALILSEEIDNYETTVLLKHTKPTLLQGLYYIKRKASACKKVLLLTADLVNYLKSTDENYSSLQDVRDLYLKLLHLYDQVLEDVNNLLNTYLSLTTQKTNEVMKILTIFSVFFMPLTFIVGVYGMNFRHLPELNYKWGYPAVLLLMAVITIVIYSWFRRKKWL
jgi:magnesium transporter